MGGIYEDTKNLALRQGPILLDLFRSYLRLKGDRFLMQSETPLATRVLTTLGLAVIYLALLIAFILLNPLVQAVSLLDLGRSSGQWILVFLISCLPLYLVIRPGTGIPSLHFFLNLQLVAASVALSVMSPVIVTGLLLTPTLKSDLNEIAQGRGRHTAFYVVYCKNMEFRRDTLLMQLELNSMTGEFDQPFLNGSIFDSQRVEEQRANAMVRYWFAQHEREKLFPEEKRQRIRELRTAIGPRFFQALPDPAPIRLEYPYFFYTLLGAQIMIPITSILSYIMIWRVFVSSRRTRRSRFLMVGRVLLAITASIWFTLWFFNALTNRGLYTRYGIAESRQMLREEAQNYAWCRFDPKGLW